MRVANLVQGTQKLDLRPEDRLGLDRLIANGDERVARLRPNVALLFQALPLLRGKDFIHRRSCGLAASSLVSS